MKLKYYKGPQPNFGDELNEFIIKKLLDSYFNVDSKYHNSFYGIGTLIDERIFGDNNVIIFGTGIRNPFIFYDTKNWDIRFVRGPISAKSLFLPKEKYITDPAYLLYLFLDQSFLQHSQNKRHKISLMPHFFNINLLNWNLICKVLNINLISPSDSVVNIINEINNSEYLITNAMHGAIIADLLRVPWLRMKYPIFGSETSFQSDLKWLDWLYSMELKEIYININYYNSYLLGKTPYRQINKLLLYFELITKFPVKRKTRNLFQLSDEKILHSKIKRLEYEVERFKKDYPL